jgi:hypothetical protein
MVALIDFFKGIQTLLLRLFLCTPLSRGHTKFPGKYIGEMGLICKPALQAHLRNRKISLL